MKKSTLSEQRLVVVLFVMVVVAFLFAQADSSEMEKMYRNSYPSITTSLEDANSQPAVPINDTRELAPSAALR